MRNLILPFLIIIVAKVFSQTTNNWSIGTKWLYENSDGTPSYYEMLVVGDTTLNGVLSSKIKHTSYREEQYIGPNNKLASRVLTDSSMQYLAHYPDSILWYNKSLQKFNKLYDFTLDIEDILNVNTELSYKIDLKKDSIINGINYTLQLIDSKKGFNESWIINGVGSTRDFFEPTDFGNVVLESRHRLICFQEGEVTIQGRNVEDCTNPLKLDVNKEESWYTIGSEWYYNVAGEHGNPVYDFSRYEVKKDTSINGLKAVILESESQKYVLHQSNEETFFRSKNKWCKIFDYRSKLGDTVTFEFLAQNTINHKFDLIVEVKCKLVKLDSVESVNGKFLHVFTFDVINQSELGAWTNNLQYQYIENIGVEEDIVPKLNLPSVGTPNFLRCVISSKDEYKGQFWKQYHSDKPCDYTLLGQQWSYSAYLPYDLHHDTIITLTHVKDTLIETKWCKKILLQIPFANENLKTEFEGMYFLTYEEANMVFTYNEYSEKFSVLYDFNAKVNDTWVLDNGVKVYVDSISYLNRFGENLKQLHVTYDQEDEFIDKSYCSIITQKLGDQRFYFPLHLGVDPGEFIPRYLFTFENNETEIDTINKSDFTCKKRKIVGLQESKFLEYISYYPTVANDFLQIESSVDLIEAEYYLISSNGQRQEVNIDTYNKLNTSTLKAGIYLLQVQVDDSIKTLKFVKE